jgi:ABC-2 type transport system permease protein
MALVRRELLTSLRRFQSFVLLLAFLLVALVIVVSAWPDDYRLFTSAAELSQRLVTRITMVLFGASVLFVPALAAGSMVVEREQETLDQLATTLIRPVGVLFGKLINALGFFLLMFISVLPILSVAFFVVGLEWRVVFAALAIIAMTSVTCAAMGLLAGCWVRRTYGAVLVAYLGVASLQIAGPVLGFFVALAMQGLSLVAPSVGQLLASAVTLGTPYGMLRASLGPAAPGQLVVAFVIQGSIAALCLYLALQGLRRAPAPPRVESEKPIDDYRLLRQRKLTFPFYLIDPLRRKKSIEDGMNPMLVRELRWGLMNNATRAVRQFYLALILYFFVGMPALYITRDFTTVVWFIVFQIGVTVLIAPAMLASALTKEYEQGNMDMLRMTLLRPREIIVGKLLAGVLAVAPVALAAVLAGLPSAFTIQDDLDLLLTGYATLLLCSLVCLCLGLFASLLTRRTATALVLTYLMSFVVFLGTWAVGVLLYTDFGFMDRYAYGGLLLCFDSPIFVFAGNAQIHARDSLFSALWLGNVAVFLTLCGGLVAVSVRGFSLHRLRDV